MFCHLLFCASVLFAFLFVADPFSEGSDASWRVTFFGGWLTGAVAMTIASFGGKRRSDIHKNDQAYS